MAASAGVAIPPMGVAVPLIDVANGVAVPPITCDDMSDESPVQLKAGPRIVGSPSVAGLSASVHEGMPSAGRSSGSSMGIPPPNLGHILGSYSSGFAPDRMPLTALCKAGSSV